LKSIDNHVFIFLGPLTQSITKLHNFLEKVSRESSAHAFSRQYSYLQFTIPSIIFTQNIHLDLNSLFCLQSSSFLLIYQKPILTCYQSSLSLIPNNRTSTSTWNVSLSNTAVHCSCSRLFSCAIH